MPRALIAICMGLLGFGWAAPAMAFPETYSDAVVLEKRIADTFAGLADVGGRMRQAATACDANAYEDARYELRARLRQHGEDFRHSKVSGPNASALQARLQEAAAAIELAKEDVPQWDCARDRTPPSEPARVAVAPGVSGSAAAAEKPIGMPPKPAEPLRAEPLPTGYLSPAAAAEAARRRLPAGVERPALDRVTSPVLPLRFCSERERVDLIEDVYNPEMAKANANARAAVGYQGRITTLADGHMRQADGATWGALLAEHKAYQPVMDATLAVAKDMGDVYAKIMAIPVADCGRTAEAPPQDPVARTDASRPVQVADRRPAKEDCPPKEGRKAIAIGPNGKVGSGARFKSKAASTALGIASGLLGGGGSPLGGGKGGDGPPMVNCRIKDSEMTVFRDPESGTELKVGAKRAKDTLVVFAKVDRSSDNGTFQTAFLQKPDGAVLAPTSIGICDLWGEWKLTVSWTRDTYVDNQLVKHEEGGWSEGGHFALPGLVSTVERPDGMWRRLGFSNASHGARMVALQYRLPPGETMDQVIHVTRPSLDPVMTAPFAMSIADGPQGPRVAPAGAANCPPALPGTTIADGPRPAGGALIQASNPAPGPTSQVREGEPKPFSDAEPPRSETLVDLRVEAELARTRAAELGGADTPERARLNVQGRIDALDERLRRMDEAITQVGGTIEGMKAWEASEEARKVWTKEDTVEDMLDPVENAGEAGIELGLLALGQPELAPLVVLLDTSEVAMRKAAKELALRDLRRNIANQKMKLSDLYKLRTEIQRQRNAEFRRLQEVNRAIDEFEARMREVNAERRRQVVERDAKIPIQDRANTTRDQDLTDEERAEIAKGKPVPDDAVRPARSAPRR